MSSSGVAGGGASVGLVQLGSVSGAQPVTTTGTFTLVTATVTGTTAFTLPALGAAQSAEFAILQDGTGGHVVTMAGQTLDMNLAAGSLTRVDVWSDGTNTYIVTENGGIISVNGKTGQVVTLGATDVAAIPATFDLSAIALATATAANIPMSGFKHTGLAAGSANGDSVRYEQSMLKVADTGAAGVAFSAGGSTPLTWTSPNDGQLHNVELRAYVNIGTTLVGGQVQYNVGGTNMNPSIFGSNSAAGLRAPSGASGIAVQPNTVVNVVLSAITGGAGTFFGQLVAN